MTRSRPPVVSERVEQRHGIQLLQTIGAAVYVLGTVRRKGDYPGTMQSKGLPDVFSFLPGRGEPSLRRPLWWECKRVGGKLRPEQAEFQALCASAALLHVVGTFDQLIGCLIREGYLRADAIPHYRTWGGA